MKAVPSQQSDGAVKASASKGGEDDCGGAAIRGREIRSVEFSTRGRVLAYGRAEKGKCSSAYRHAG